MITVYGQPGCAPCQTVKRTFENRGIDFEYVDISHDEQGFDKIISLGFKQTPVIITDTDAWSGIDVAKMNALTA